MIITHAALELLDMSKGVHKYSDAELDFSKDLTNEYVKKVIDKVNQNTNKRVGKFLDDSLIKKALLNYDPKNFINFSKEISDIFLECLKKSGITDSSDLLVVEYRIDENTFLGLIVLDNLEAITHNTVTIDNVESNQFTKNMYVLPTSSLKINTFLLISLPDLNFYACEKFKVVEGEKKKIFEEAINASYHPSTSEIIRNIKQETKRISEETGTNYLENLSNVNNYIFQQTSDNNINIKELADIAFKDEESKKEFKANLSMKGINEVEPIEYNLISNKVRNQKIKTDTGIELIIPQEFFRDNNNVEIKNNEDGTMSIEIKNFTKLISR